MSRFRIYIGFTLIEILAVITIIAMLAALTFPVFYIARRHSLQTTCLSHERQIGIALLQYAADYDDQLLYPTGYTGWSHDAAYPYIKNVNVFHCPEDPTENEHRYFPKAHFDEMAYVNSYALNSNLQYESLAVLTAPTRTVLTFEVANCTETFTENHLYAYGSSSGNGGHSMYCPTPDETACKTLQETQPDMPQYATGKIGGRNVNGILPASPRHREGANYVASDGHAVWLRPESVSSGDSQPIQGTHCGQDDPAPGCTVYPAAAGTENQNFTLTFSQH